MKCPDKELVDGLHDMFEDVERNKCPECGSEMKWYETSLEEARKTGNWLGWWYCICGEKVKP